jgi:hypothetical protein
MYLRCKQIANSIILRSFSRLSIRSTYDCNLIGLLSSQWRPRVPPHLCSPQNGSLLLSMEPFGSFLLPALAILGRDGGKHS